MPICKSQTGNNWNFTFIHHREESSLSLLIMGKKYLLYLFLPLYSYGSDFSLDSSLLMWIILIIMALYTSPYTNNKL